MPANEFEKQVQKRLDDFQLNPSASVWKNVEAQIRKKKRRRVILFFLLPLALGLLSYSIYYFVQSQHETEQAPQVTAKNNDSSTNDINKTAETKEPTNQSTKGENIRSEELTKTKPGPGSAKPVKNDREKKETEFQIVPGKPSADRRKNKPLVIPNDEITITKKKENPTKDNPSLVPGSKAQTNNDVVVTTDIPETARISKDKNELQPLKPNDQLKNVVADPKDPVPAKADAIKTEDVVADPKEPVTAKADSTNTTDVVKTDKKETIPTKKSSKLKIKWGFDVSGGITSNETKVFSLHKSYQADATSYNSSPAAVASPFPGAATTLPPSSVKPGPGFRVAVVGELEISKRSRFSMGLQYMYASNKIKTGTADQALRYPTNNSFALAGQVYRGPQNNSYTNSYHFVSIPVSYHWQINKSEKVGLRWNAGISPSYLVSTNALAYSSSNGGSYYHDNSAFNKFHFSIGTGLSLRIKAKKGMEYIFGPEISFDTRKLMSNASQQQQYLIYGGVGARILFPSKKK